MIDLDYARDALAYDVVTGNMRWKVSLGPRSKTAAADRQRLYKAVDALCLQAGTDTSETVDWLCGPHGGMAKLFAAYFSPDMKSQSFAEKYPRNPDAKCKCEHWQVCIDCHPTYVGSALKGEV